jgi:hypothetical protein
VVTCCVVGCGKRYNVRVKDISFFHYPKVKVSGHPEHVVSKSRRLEWLKRTEKEVCSEHFVSGNTVVLKINYYVSVAEFCRRELEICQKCPVFFCNCH